MSAQCLGLLVGVVGLQLLLVSVFADLIGIGEGEFGSRQTAGTVVGALILVVGAVLFVRARRAEEARSASDSADS